MYPRKLFCSILLAILIVMGGLPGCTNNQPGFAGGQSIGDPYLPELGNTGYDVQHYTLRFTVDPDQMFILGRATIEARSTLEQLGQISLDFTGFDVTKLTVDGRIAKYTRLDRKLVVSLPRQRNSGQAFSIDVTYSGAPSKVGSIFLKNIPPIKQLGFNQRPEYHEIFTFSFPDGANMWYPSNDHPRDKATFTFELTVPKGMQGIANGVLTNTRTGIAKAFPDGRTGDRYTWEMKQPMATYLATVVVGQYTLIEGKTPGGVKLRSYISPEKSDKFKANSYLIGDALDWFSERLGDYPYEEFGYVTVMTQFTAETQSMVLMDDNLDDKNYPLFLIGTLAENWFGGYVSMDTWADYWRNQGLMAYFSTLYIHHGDMAAVDANIKEWEQDIPLPDYPLNNPPPDEIFSPNYMFNSGKLMHDLHKTMGSDAFFSGLRAFFKQYGHGTASQKQFQAELEKAYGKPLDAVFEKWFTSQKKTRH